MTTQDKELQALITNPENLRAALEMEQQTALARKQVAKTFTSNITKKINANIAAAPEIYSQWNVVDKQDPTGETYIWIQTVRHGIKPNYNFYAKWIFASGRYGKYYWQRPAWVEMKQPPQETASISEKLIMNGWSGAEGWSLASVALRGGEMSYVLPDNNDIITCHEDNHNPEHPLATEIAEEMWTMFTAYRADIEALPSFQQTTTP